LSALRAAERYVARGFAVVPVPHGKKGPTLEGWEGLRLGADELHEHFNGKPQNIGLVLGEASGDLVDVDLDAEETVRIAGRFLPPTVTSGRQSSPHSHWWYVAPGAESVRYKDVDGQVLVELRSTGCQTIVEPSVHPSGERVVWHRGGLDLAEVEAGDLSRRVRELATAALIARHVPPAGGRHDFAMPVAGFLLRSGRLNDGTTLKIMLAAWHAAGADSREAVRDLEGIVRDTAEHLVRGEPVIGGPTLEESAPGVAKLLSRWWGWDRHRHDEGVSGKEERPPQAQLLVRCAASAGLFHTPAGEAYASVPVGDHRETHQVKSKGFRRWLVRGYIDQYERPPGAQALQDALGLLEARAQFDGTQREVFVRVAGREGAIYVDLANERWEVVEITAGGWRVLPGERAAVRFRRPRGMLALPTPASGDGRDGLDGLLGRFVNVSDEGAIRLIIAWLVQALRPTGPYPVLIFQGEQGSAKSTAERLVRSLVDPSTAPLRTTPRNERDLVIAATNSWCVAFDNISTLQPWLSDASCRLSTGGGFSARELYTDADEVLFDATRPQLFNGITEVATRPDLLDRALVVTLPPIPEERRRPEAELWKEFEEVRPRILAALFDAVSGALGAVQGVRLEGMPRMADFAVWATAAEEALSWKPGAFMAAYSGNRAEATENALEADPVAIAVREFMEDQDEWTGTAGELWEALNGLVGEAIRHTKAWPGAPNALSARLKRLAPALRGIGIEYGEERSGSKGTRRKTLMKKGPAKDRQSRQDRQYPGEVRQDGQLDTDGVDRPTDGTDSVLKEDRQRESAANHGFSDGPDSSDDDSRTDSSLSAFLREPPAWYRSQAKECGRQGAPERLLEPLAYAVAYEVYGDTNRWSEVLPRIEAALGGEGAT
jgi:hypothetical protein